jgi:PAS domain S-box-containing protein
MEKENKIKKQLLEEIKELRIRLEEAEETISAIRSGEVDAIVVSGSQGDQVFTLTGAERTYRILIETMNEGAATLNQEGMIIFCNQRLSEMIKTPLEKVIGTPMRQFIRSSDLLVFDSLIEKGLQKSAKGEVSLIKSDGTVLPVLLSVSTLQRDNANMCSIVVTDLTAQKHIEEELRRHRDNLEELVKDRTNELETSNQRLQKRLLSTSGLRSRFKVRKAL